MERPIFQSVGTPAEQLDTPALVVDLDAMAHNIEVLHLFFRQSSVKVRPMCPAISAPTSPIAS